MKVLKQVTFSLLVTLLIVYITLLFSVDNQYADNEGSEHELNYQLLYEDIKDKVIPYIVYANVVIEGKEYIGEIIEDKQNGTKYCVKVEDNIFWLDNKKVSIIDPFIEEVVDLTNEEIEIYINYNKYDSLTDYFLWIDIYRNQTYVLKKENDEFKMINRLLCATGQNITPTKRGLYEITAKGKEFIGRDKSYKCYYFMQYSGSYLLHSFPFDLENNVKDDRVEARVSNGCVRYSLSDSKYLYDLIPSGTSIWLN